jgi:uncharacterized protein YbbC (DUF1343 family)/CubicO group peptidase (beta-lactamase class C family)
MNKWLFTWSMLLASCGGSPVFSGPLSPQTTQDSSPPTQLAVSPPTPQTPESAESTESAESPDSAKLANSAELLESLGFDPRGIPQLEELVQREIAAGKMPGCVICFGRAGKIAYLRAFGNRQLEPVRLPMTEDTVFDLASLTKPIATGTSIMKLVEQGRLRLGARVSEIFPDFGINGKEGITIQDLLVHQSGLTPANPIGDYAGGVASAWEKICQLKPLDPVGTVFKYSDVNFIVLGKIVEQVSGQSLAEFTRQELFQPLGMRETTFVPDASLRERTAPTERRGDRWIQGEVHDPRAYALGGVAGHAGLFSTASDLARYASMLLGRGTLQTVGDSEVQDAGADDLPIRILSPRTVERMTAGYPVSAGEGKRERTWERGLGWDRRSAYSSNRGDLLSGSAFGHGGFTGTVLWIDPELDLFLIFLSNRLHPEGKGLVNPLAGQIANRVASSLQPRPASKNSAAVPPSSRTTPAGEVLTGLDVLQRDQFQALAGQRIGLITNHTGVNAEGISVVQLLHASPQVELVALFSPEHGFEGKLDIARIDDTTDQGTGLKVYSLYGQTRRPTPEMCDAVDTFVFDIQDIGTRFYTYISTMGESLIAADLAGKRFVVLDRPNPIGGTAVAGPMLDRGRESFVGFHSLPVRHGMTSGEIALLLKAELGLSLDLQVIPCEGWARDQLYDSTGLIWINPSPNMRSLNQALLYPGVGLLEMTNLSVGRGTDTPFERVGAPWIRGRQFAAALNRLELPGVRFTPIQFTPVTSKFADENCQGVQITITDRNQFDPLAVGFGLAATLRALYRDEWETENYNRLLLNQDCFEGIVNLKSWPEVLELSNRGLPEFLRRREAVLLYR